MIKKGVFFLCFLGLISCAIFIRVKLNPSLAFTLTISTNQGISLVKTDNSLDGVPTEYFLHKKLLYIVDPIKNRLLVYSRDNQIQFQITNRSQKELELIYDASNQILQPFENNNELQNLYTPGQIVVDKQNIYIENVISMKEEENSSTAFSYIIKFDNRGQYRDLIGLKTKNNKIYPFRGFEKFSLDLKNNYFIFLKNDQNWTVLKMDATNQILYQFNSYSFLTNSVIPQEKDKIVVIEDIDHSNYGEFLIVQITYYDKNYIFDKMVYYKIDLATHKIEKLFQLKNEKSSFVLIDYSNLIYLVHTNQKENEEEVIVSLYNLNGKLIRNYVMGLRRKEALWLNMKFQKDSVISALQLVNNQLNVMRWK